jgi:signal transduction histidine kinase
LQRLWRHSVAVGLAARRLARDAEDRDPDRVARAGLLHNLGLWAAAAVDPEWLVRWLADESASLRHRRERVDLGLERRELGRRLAERWGCDRLVVDAAWLHHPDDASLLGAAEDPERLAILQEACRWAEKTPWSLAPRSGETRDWEHEAGDPQICVLVAEVQSRCGAPFLAPDASPHEESFARQTAQLRLRLARAESYAASCDRFFHALADSDPAENPDAWARRAGEVWCQEPAVTAARVVWGEASTGELVATGSPAVAMERPNLPFGQSAGSPGAAIPPAEGRIVPRQPSFLRPLRLSGGSRAEVHLWHDPDRLDEVEAIAASPVFAAWEAWARRVELQAGLERRLRHVVQAHREARTSETARLGALKLDALAEFAAGAGHEINNPLAVIAGRAQLLLNKSDDPERSRSLQIIIAQALRAHRILADLMFVARPPRPEPRPCRPGEILLACLHDLEAEFQARRVELSRQIVDPAAELLAEPDALRHLAEILILNAVQATPPGGRVTVRQSATAGQLEWTVVDSGRGFSAADGAHLLDPFYCGRKAGRGLGLGLPRASRIVEQAGGRLRWSSSPGQGTVFRVDFPERTARPRGDRDRPPRMPGGRAEPAASLPDD